MSKGERQRGRESVELYLVRHAHAGDTASWRGNDDERPLSPKGERQAAAMARFLSRIGLKPTALLTSPRLRATQTAAPIGKALHMDVHQEPLLAAGLDLADLEQILSAAGDPPSLLLVGHDPDFSELARELTGAGELPLPKGSLARIDVVRPLAPGRGVLRWLVPPDLLPDD